ncbi:hypothetical protein GGF37_004121, partial [Kickxella alabastrina]
ESVKTTAQPVTAKRHKRQMKSSQPTNTKRKAAAASKQAPSGKRARKTADTVANAAQPQNNRKRVYKKKATPRQNKTQPVPITPSDSSNTKEGSPAGDEQADTAPGPCPNNAHVDAKPSSSERQKMFERMEPAMRELRRHLSGPHPSVVELAAPVAAEYKQRAATVADIVHRAMEQLSSGSKHTPAGDLAIMEELINADSVWPVRLARSNYAAIDYLASRLRQDYDALSRWTGAHTPSDHNGSSSSSGDVSKGAESFTSFVSRIIQGLHQHAKGEQGRPEPRRVLIPSTAPVSTTDTGEECTHQTTGRIGLGIDSALATVATTDSSEATLDGNVDAIDNNDEWYAGLFAAIEVGQGLSSGDVDDAALQLSKHCRRIYRAQPNRRFVWGLTICGSSVRAYLFGCNFVLVSEAMDICTEAGRGEVIKLFVNLSFSEDHRLGFDPSIRHLHDLDCWEITVPSTAATDSADSMGSSGGNAGSYGSTGRTFYSSHISIEASHLFGRLTRCFLATDKKPTRDSRIRSKDCTVFIKDAWTKVADGSGVNDVRDEVAHLRKLTQTLERYPELAGTYPVLEAGGRIKFQSCSSNTYTEDTTRSILGCLFDNVRVGEKIRKLPFCAYKRIATSLIGMPLDRLQSIPELIIAVADAMRAHRAIAEHCNILHRDISAGNFLFRSMMDGTVKGMLVDFDHAIDCENLNAIPQNEHIGTLNFMSVNNLEGNSNKRTELDDWEALIYALVWLGKFGLNGMSKYDSDTDEHRRIAGAKINYWVDSTTLKDIARYKRDNLDNSSSFKSILNEFD